MISGIHQIELTSRCNLKCRYCVHPTMRRAKADMTLETLTQALEWVKFFQKKGTQGELNIAGIGESTIHPDVIGMVDYIRATVGKDIRLVLATNGVYVDDDIVACFKRNRVDVFVSLHRPERAAAALNKYKQAGVLCGYSIDPTISSVDWAGQIKWPVTTQWGTPCPWIGGQYVIVTSQGYILSCSFDGQELDGMLGSVEDNIEEMEVLPYSLCKFCHHVSKRGG